MIWKKIFLSSMIPIGDIQFDTYRCCEICKHIITEKMKR